MQVDKDITKLKPTRFDSSNCQNISSNKFWEIQAWDYTSTDDKNYRVVVRVPKISNKEAIEKEIKILNCISHKNIIQLYGSVEQEKLTCYVFEWAKYGSLRDVVVKKTVSLQYNDLDKQRWLADAACGLAYLHSDLNPPIRHGDLKSNNILLFAGNDGTVAKLAEFGLANLQPKTETGDYSGDLWSAPELISAKQESIKSDVWSFGATVVEIFIEDHPYRELLSKGIKSYKIGKGIVSGEHNPLKSAAPSDLEKIPSKMRDILRHCFCHDRNMRWTMKQISAIL